MNSIFLLCPMVLCFGVGIIAGASMIVIQSRAYLLLPDDIRLTDFLQEIGRSLTYVEREVIYGRIAGEKIKNTIRHDTFNEENPQG